MKKLIITIFIIFSTLQAFAVLPPMQRYTQWFDPTGSISYGYVNTLCFICEPA